MKKPKALTLLKTPRAGAAVQGDRATCLRSPDEVEFYYLLLPSSTAFVRCALIDS